MAVTALVRTKDVPVGRVDMVDGGIFQATAINWSTGEMKYIGDFDEFAKAQRAIKREHKKIAWQVVPKRA